MTASDISRAASPPRRTPAEAWRRRSRMVRRLRIALPVMIGLILAALAGSIAYNAITGQVGPAADVDQPIRLMTPRFVGRDDKGRAFVLTALSATRDPKDYQRVMLDHPALVLDEGGPDLAKITSLAGIYQENTRKLELNGDVRLEGARGAFKTAQSLYDTKTGELAGSGPIQGAGSLGEINAKSYGVDDKGEHMVFRGGVHTRIQTK